MNDYKTTGRIVILDLATTQLDSYLLHIRDMERARRRQQWHIYLHVNPSEAESASLVDRLRYELPTLHLDTAEKRLN